MTKLEKVSKAMELKTYPDIYRVTSNVDGRHKGKKYCLCNMSYENLSEGYNTLTEIIRDFKLEPYMNLADLTPAQLAIYENLKANCDKMGWDIELLSKGVVKISPLESLEFFNGWDVVDQAYGGSARNNNVFKFKEMNHYNSTIYSVTLKML